LPAGTLRAAHDGEWVLGTEASASIIFSLELGDRARELRRLNGYERRAISRRRAALRRIDFERIEAIRGERRP